MSILFLLENIRKNVLIFLKKSTIINTNIESFLHINMHIVENVYTIQKTFH